MDASFDLSDYAPFFWTGIANRWTASSSRSYLERFGIGIVEWRILAAINALGHSTSYDAARLSETDPAAANRAMNELCKKGYVVAVAGRFAGRSKPFTMSTEGRQLFERVATLARARSNALLAALSQEEKGQLITLLRRVHSRLAVLNENSVVTPDGMDGRYDPGG